MLATILYPSRVLSNFATLPLVPFAVGNVGGVRESSRTLNPLPPTVREMVERFGFRSRSTMHRMTPVVGTPPHLLPRPECAPPQSHPELAATIRRTSKIKTLRSALDVDTMPPPASCRHVFYTPNGQPYGPSYKLIPTRKICTRPSWTLESTPWAQTKASIRFALPSRYSPLPLSTCNECQRAIKVN